MQSNDEFIEITREMRFKETAGRYTLIMPGAYGVVLTDKNLDRVFETASKKQISLALNTMESALHNGGTPALVAGYVCVLRAGDYRLMPEPPKMGVVGEII